MINIWTNQRVTLEEAGGLKTWDLRISNVWTAVHLWLKFLTFFLCFAVFLFWVFIWQQLSKHMSLVGLGDAGPESSGWRALQTIGSRSTIMWWLQSYFVCRSECFINSKNIEMSWETTALGEVLLILCIQWVLDASVKVGEESIIAYLGWNRTGSSLDLHYWAWAQV